MLGTAFRVRPEKLYIHAFKRLKECVPNINNY